MNENQQDLFDKLLDHPNPQTEDDELKLFLEFSKELKSHKLPAPDPVSKAKTLIAVNKTAKFQWLLKQFKLHKVYELFNKIISPFKIPTILVRTVSYAVIVILLFSTVGVSALSLPGDLLYPIKIITEKFTYILQFNDEDKAELRIILSKKRFEEMQSIYKKTGIINKSIIENALKEAQEALANSEQLESKVQSEIKNEVTDLSSSIHKTLDNYDYTNDKDREWSSKVKNQCRSMMNGRSGKFRNRMMMHH